MAQSIPQHTHCQMCGKAITTSETLCSEDCKQKYQTLVKKRRRLNYIMLAAVLFMIILLILSSTLAPT